MATTDTIAARGRVKSTLYHRPPVVGHRTETPLARDSGGCGPQDSTSCDRAENKGTG